ISPQFQRAQQAGKFPPASRFFFMPGMAPPNGGPDHILLVATTALHVVNEVATPPERPPPPQQEGGPENPGADGVCTAREARAAIQKMAAQKIPAVKIWVDDRRGTYPKMTPEVYNAII